MFTQRKDTQAANGVLFKDNIGEVNVRIDWIAVNSILLVRIVLNILSQSPKYLLAFKNIALCGSVCIVGVRKSLRS